MTAAFTETLAASPLTQLNSAGVLAPGGRFDRSFTAIA